MWGLVAQVGLGLINFFLKRHAEKVAVHEAFLKFVESMGAAGLVSVKLRDSYEEQRRKNLEKIKAEK